MSLFDDLLGSTGSADTANRQTQNQVQQQQKDTSSATSQTGVTNTSGSQNTSSTQTGSQVTSGSQSTSNNKATTGAQNTSQAETSVTSSLDPTTIALIGSLLQPLAAQAANPNGGNAGTANGIAQQLITKSQTPAVSASDIAGKQSAAVTSFNTNEAVQNARLVQSLGSKNNTYSALVDQKGQQDLASTLAGIVADADTTNAQLSSQNLSSAIQALTASSQIGSAPIANLAALLSVLKGATTATTGQSGQTTSSAGQENDTGQANTLSTTDQITQAIQAILSQQGVVSQTDQNATSSETDQGAASGTSTSNTSGKQGTDLLGMIFG